MSSSLLLKLYLKSPSFFKKYIMRYILKKEGGQMYSSTLREIYKKKYKIVVGYGSYGGCFNLDNTIPAGVTFGSYCSIAKSIRIFRANHPKGLFTSHPLLYNPIAGYVKKDQLDRPTLSIGHDVWIGEWAVILPGVKTIGNGAIIGAGSIVTKDVEPYAIVAGNPARKLGQRFSAEIQEKFENSKWWDLDVKQLIPEIDRLNSIANSNTV